MKPSIATADAERLARPAEGRAGAVDTPMAEEEVLRVLARIARTGRPSDRLRAAELIGRQLGLFREGSEKPQRSFADLVLAAQRLREARKREEEKPAAQ